MRKIKASTNFAKKSDLVSNIIYSLRYSFLSTSNIWVYQAILRDRGVIIKGCVKKCLTRNKRCRNCIALYMETKNTISHKYILCVFMFFCEMKIICSLLFGEGILFHLHLLVKHVS